MIYTISWYLINAGKENQTPNFLKDNNKEIIYQPQSDYFDKLEFQENDLLKAIEEGRQERLEQIFETLIEINHPNATPKSFPEDSPDSSPIPRHPQAFKSPQSDTTL